MEMSTENNDTSTTSTLEVAPAVSENSRVSTSESPANGVEPADISWPIEVCHKDTDLIKLKKWLKLD